MIYPYNDDTVMLCVEGSPQSGFKSLTTPIQLFVHRIVSGGEEIIAGGIECCLLVELGTFAGVCHVRACNSPYQELDRFQLPLPPHTSPAS